MHLMVLGIWGMWITRSMPLLLGSLRPGVFVLVKVASMIQIDMFKNDLYSMGPLPPPQKKKRPFKKEIK